MMRIALLPVLAAAQSVETPMDTAGTMDHMGEEMPSEYEELGGEKYDASMWEDQFAQMDTNGDGFLSMDEALNVGASEEEKESIRTFVESADIDQDGMVSLDEYKSFADAHEQHSFEEKLKVIETEFQSADQDQDGYVTVPEVEELVGDEVQKEDVQTFFNDADLDGDGKLSYDEYVDYAFRNEEMEDIEPVEETPEPEL